MTKEQAVNDQEIEEAFDKVKDAASFIAFLDVLRTSWEDAIHAEREDPSNPYSSMHGWENTDIGSFLEAAIAGGTANKVDFENEKENESTAWRQAAQIIMMGKYYE
ncbi:hypothetical protein HGG70_04610 [Rhodobacteraceae bacterium R_SAG4]|nr:hypothetical protein [Rhodobacteraceae bacterium R_SAG4]